ncbi:FixH family protein [Flavobacterium lacus]|uniref:FixH protein n=1 Tax=Flavobacterium lacus TaxID=1353778 RepID=A0A328WXN3_9FLAO|nr:FixH family protein [Flavobacterium lacus]RAR50962.1 FixH protein [Flavobacterium lacus]
MKINWGIGIVIAIVLFISFILYFVIKVQVDSTYDHDLVVEEYYKQELVFEKRMEKEQNDKNLALPVEIIAQEDGLKIVFPTDIDATKIKGKVSLYRPSNLKLDFEVPISLSGSHLLIPKNNLVGGRWDISIDWTYEGKEILTKKTIYL